MYFTMIESSCFQIGHQGVYACMGGRKTERAGIPYHPGIDTLTYDFIDFIAMSGIHDEIVNHFTGRTF